MKLIKYLGFVFLVLFSVVSVNATPYNLSSYNYNDVNLSVSAQDTQATGWNFIPDGTKAYMTGGTNDKIFEYDCSIAYNVSSCSYNSESLSVSAQDSNPRDWHWNDVGNKSYMTGLTNDKIFEYDCSIAYNVSSCVYNSNFLPLNPPATVPTGLYFKDGNSLFVNDAGTASVYSYTCSVSYDITSCTYNGDNLSSSNNGYWSFNSAGTKGVILNDFLNLVQGYDCSSAFNLSTCSLNPNNNLSMTIETTLRSSTFNSNGQYMYILGTGLNTVLQYETDIVSAVVTINNPTDSSYYNTTLIDLNVSTDLDTDLTYIFNGGSETILCDNCNSSTNITLTAVEGLNNLTVISNLSGEITTARSSFTVDTSLPIINNNILAEYNTYTINGFNSSCSDINLDYCNISLDSQNVLLNTTSFTFSQNGNISYTITAQDLAGNSISESGTILVNPYQSFRFHDGTSYISSYSFGGRNDTSTYVQYLTYNDGLTLSDNTLLFEKLGYGSQNFTFNLNTTSDINITYNVSIATVQLTIRDKSTQNVVSGETFSLSFIGPTALENTTSTGYGSFEGLLDQGEYKLIITSTNYETETLYFTYTNQEILNLTAYVVNATDPKTGYVIIQVLDGDGATIDNVLVQAKQWVTSEADYIAVSEAKTAGGVGELNIILDDEDYIFRASLNGDYVESVAQTITTANNGKTITLTLIVESLADTSYRYENVDITLTEDFNETTNISTISFTWDNSLGTDLTGCVNIYRNQNYRLLRLNTSCTTSDSATNLKAYALDLETYDYVIKAEFYDNGDYIEVGRFVHYGVTNIFSILENNNLHYFIVLLLTVLSIFAGIQLENIFIGTMALILTAILSIVIAPSIMTASVSGFLCFIGFIILWGATR